MNNDLFIQPLIRACIALAFTSAAAMAQTRAPSKLPVKSPASAPTSAPVAAPIASIAPWKAVMRIVPNPLPAGRCAGISLEIQDPDGYRVGTLSNGAEIDQRHFVYTIADMSDVAWQNDDPSQATLCAKAGALGKATTIHVVMPDGLTADVPFATLAPGKSAAPAVYVAQAKIRPAGLAPTYAMSTSTIATPATVAAPTQPPSSGTGVTGTGAPIGPKLPDASTQSSLRWSGQLTLDGLTVPAMLISGGSASIVRASNTSGGTTSFYNSRVASDPLVVAVAPASEIVTWISGTWLGQVPAKSGVLSTDASSSAGLAIKSLGGKADFASAVIISTRIPALAQKQNGEALLTLTLSPEKIARSAASPTAHIAPTPISSFHFTINGLDGGAVQKIDAFEVITSVSPDIGAVIHGAVRQNVQAVFPDIFVTVTESQAHSWIAWYDDWFVNGNHLKSDEKSFTLQLLGGAGVLATIDATGVGLVALREGEPIGGQATVVAELYVTRMTIKDK